jgi:uncharacterized protein YcbX
MVVDPHGCFVTQREQPRLALIATSLGSDGLALSAHGVDPLVVALDAPRGPVREVVVWASHLVAHDAGDAAASWLSAVLGIDVRLVRFDPAQTRRCDPQYAGDSAAHTAFADGYPVLAIGEASLADLNSRLAATGAAALPMNRFRPNIVLAGLEAYDEDHIDTIAADGVTLKLVKACTRCQVTTTDQDTARVGREPLATLAGYRMNPALAGVTFGVNAIVVAGEGRELTVGTEVDCRFSF